MNETLWGMLSDEELAEQTDQWRYASEQAQRDRKWGRARWCRAMSTSAENALIDRICARDRLLNGGRQLAFDIPGRISPEERNSAA